MSSHVLALYLDAPLQSWGYQSRFDRRTTLSYPTRSGVLGMICAALGIDRFDSTALRRFDGLRITVLCFGGRARLRDFHTVGGGYDRKLEKQHLPVTADGKLGNTMVTLREYLQDARFGVLLEADPVLLEEIGSALEDPKWGIWLGRKSCVPATPVCQGFFPSVAAAEEHLCALEASRPSFKGGAAKSASPDGPEASSSRRGADPSAPADGGPVVPPEGDIRSEAPGKQASRPRSEPEQPLVHAGTQGFTMGKQASRPRPEPEGEATSAAGGRGTLPHREAGSRSSPEEGVFPIQGRELPRPFRRVVEVSSFEAGTDTLRDVPLDFGHRRFGLRRVGEPADEV